MKLNFYKHFLLIKIFEDHPVQVFDSVPIISISNVSQNKIFKKQLTIVPLKEIHLKIRELLTK